MLFTPRKIIFRAINIGKPDVIFRRIILYVCIFCIINTLFFIIVKRSPAQQAPFSVEHTWQHKHQISSKEQSGIQVNIKSISKSLLRLILENCLYSSSTAPEKEFDDEVKKVEYVFQDNPCLFAITYSQSQFNIHYFPFSYLNSLLDTLTPPPKCLA